MTSTRAEAAVLLGPVVRSGPRSRLAPFVKAARTMRQRRDLILNAVEHGISNGRVEGLNTKVRLIIRRGYGFHSPDAALALVMLGAGPIDLKLPHEPPHAASSSPATASTCTNARHHSERQESRKWGSAGPGVNRDAWTAGSAVEALIADATSGLLASATGLVAASTSGSRIATRFVIRDRMECPAFHRQQRATTGM